MKHCKDHVSVYINVDGQYLQVEMDCVPPDLNSEADEFWMANDVRDMTDNMFWSIDPAPMGATPGECLDAVIAEARR